MDTQYLIVPFMSHTQIATTRRLTVHLNPPSSCVLKISVRGVKIGVKADDSPEAQVMPRAALPSYQLACGLEVGRCTSPTRLCPLGAV